MDFEGLKLFYPFSKSFYFQTFHFSFSVELNTHVIKDYWLSNANRTLTVNIGYDSYGFTFKCLVKGELWTHATNNYYTVPIIKPKVITNQNSLFMSRDWLSANQGSVLYPSK